MGRIGLGVEVRETSIRLSFTFEGRQYKRTLKANGQPISPTPANIGFAERLAAEIRSRIKYGTFSMREYFPEGDSEAGVITVGQQLDTWFATLRVEESTRAGYASAVRFWKAAPCDRFGKALGDLPLRSLVASHVLTALASRPALNAKTVNNYRGALKYSLDAAVLDRLLEVNPVTSIPRAKAQKIVPDPFTRGEVEQIIQEMHRRYPGHVHNLCEFWFWTGLRTSELLGLTWPNVDLARSQLHVNESRIRGRYKQRTKTHVARTVLLNSRAKEAIARQKELTGSLGGTVFLYPPTGGPWTDDGYFLRNYWMPVLKTLGIRYRRPYTMRHSYATAMLMAGMNPAFCAKQLGHSVEVFLGTYSRWLDGDRNALEMGRLEASLGGGEEPKKLNSSLKNPRARKKSA